jgi:NitT/TauT family transport system permease protein
MNELWGAIEMETPAITQSHDRRDLIYAEIAVFTDVPETRLPLWERIYNTDVVRQTAIVLLLALGWEIYGRWLGNSLIFPSLGLTLEALWNGLTAGELTRNILSSLQTLLTGYLLGVALAFLFTIAATTSRIGNDFLTTLTSMFNPLPAIALFPLALIWFGLGTSSIVFVLVHSVLWAVALNTNTGFRGVSKTLRMVGRNCGLGGMGMIVKVILPAALPGVLSGLKIGWAFAWRTLIAAEMVFGVASGDGGLGWFILQSKNSLETPSVFAGLLAVILVGLIVELLVFRMIERSTIERWGMQQ